MSHGKEQTIAKRLISFGKILALIKSCSYLMTQPKIFFIQTCQGENKMKSSQAEEMSDHQKTNSPSSNLQSNLNKNIVN